MSEFYDEEDDLTEEACQEYDKGKQEGAREGIAKERKRWRQRLKVLNEYQAHLQHLESARATLPTPGMVVYVALEIMRGAKCRCSSTIPASRNCLLHSHP